MFELHCADRCSSSHPSAEGGTFVCAHLRCSATGMGDMKKRISLGVWCLCDCCGTVVGSTVGALTKYLHLFSNVDIMTCYCLHTKKREHISISKISLVLILHPNMKIKWIHWEHSTHCWTMISSRTKTSLEIQKIWNDGSQLRYATVGPSAF